MMNRILVVVFLVAAVESCPYFRSKRFTGTDAPKLKWDKENTNCTERLNELVENGTRRFTGAFGKIGNPNGMHFVCAEYCYTECKEGQPAKRVEAVGIITSNRGKKRDEVAIECRCHYTAKVKAECKTNYTIDEVIEKYQSECGDVKDSLVKEVLAANEDDTPAVKEKKTVKEDGSNGKKEEKSVKQKVRATVRRIRKNK